MKVFLKVLGLLSCVFALLSGDTTVMIAAGLDSATDER